LLRCNRVSFFCHDVNMTYGFFVSGLQPEEPL
jgi:hypothetical protein